MTIVYQDLPVIHGTGEILKDSKTDWRVLKLKTVAVSKAFDQPEKYWLGRSQRMFDCGSTLEFAVDPHGNKRLIRALFCRDRMCPSCQRRRSMAIFHQVKAVCQSAQKENPTLKYLLLTLTVPNIKADRLSDEVKHLTKSFDRLIKRAEVKRSVKGFFRALEVTYNGKRDDYHPHFHVLLAVPSNYFAKNYINQNRWLELWRESTRYPEITQVDIRVIKPNRKREGSSSIESAAAEVGKYATKPSNYVCEMPDGNYLAHSKAVKELALGIRNKRLIAFGGILKEHHKKLNLQDVESDSVDLVHVGEENDTIEAVMVQVFRWNVGLRQYVG